MNCQMFSVGLSSGHLGGNGTRVMLGGTMRRADIVEIQKKVAALLGLPISSDGEP
jgi:hypothetical protein